MFDIGDVVETVRQVGAWPVGSYGVVTNDLDDGYHYLVKMNTSCDRYLIGTLIAFLPDSLQLRDKDARGQSAVGLRANEGKLPYHLLPDDAIEAVVKVLQKGAEKYAERNWQQGLRWDSQCAASLQRHLSKWKMGEDIDEESGEPHVALIATNALFLTHFHLTGKGEDDRYDYKKD